MDLRSQASIASNLLPHSPALLSPPPSLTLHPLLPSDPTQSKAIPTNSYNSYLIQIFCSLQSKLGSALPSHFRSAFLALLPLKKVEDPCSLFQPHIAHENAVLLDQPPHRSKFLVLQHEKPSGRTLSNNSEQLSESFCSISPNQQQMRIEQLHELGRSQAGVISEGVYPWKRPESMPWPSTQFTSQLISRGHPLVKKVEALSQLNAPSSFNFKAMSQILKVLEVLIASQAGIDLLSLAQMFKETKKEGSRRSTRLRGIAEEKVKAKVRAAQTEMQNILSEEPDQEKVVFHGKLRGQCKSDGTPFVGSEYRGVCCNGRQYQMFIMIDGKKKLYSGGHRTAKEAGLAYDKAAIQLRGLKARTNLSYTKAEALEILLRDDHVFDISRLEKDIL